MSPHVRRFVTAALVLCLGLFAWTVAVTAKSPITELSAPRWQGTAEARDVVVPSTPPTSTASPTPLGDPRLNYRPFEIAYDFWIIIAAAVVLAIGFLGVRHGLKTLFKRRGRELASVVSERGPDNEAMERDVKESLSQTLERLRTSSSLDSHDVIIQCWRQLEAIGERHGVARQYSDTSSDFVASFLTKTGVDPESVSALAGLYREASFSLHVATDAHRHAAIAHLERTLDCLKVRA